MLLILATDAEWEESKHPRAENGQFGSGGGGVSSSAAPAKSLGDLAKTSKTPRDLIAKALFHNQDLSKQDLAMHVIGKFKVKSDVTLQRIERIRKRIKKQGAMLDHMKKLGFEPTNASSMTDMVLKKGDITATVTYHGPDAGKWSITGPGGKVLTSGNGAAALKNATPSSGPAHAAPQAAKSKEEAPKAQLDPFPEEGEEVSEAAEAVHKTVESLGYVAHETENGEVDDPSAPVSYENSQTKGKITVKPDGTWTAETPGHMTKTGNGAEALEQLIKHGVVMPGVKNQNVAPVGPATAPAIETKDSEKLRRKIADHRPTPNAKESAALSYYKGSGYQQLNHALRHEPEMAKNNEKVQALDAFFERAVIPFEVKLSRKVGGEYAKILKSMTDEGTSFVERGYVSCATSDKVWSGNLKFTVICPAGTHGAAIRTATEHDHEQEVVLARGTRFVVEHYDAKDNHLTVRADQSKLQMWKNSQAKAKEPA